MSERRTVYDRYPALEPTNAHSWFKLIRVIAYRFWVDDGRRSHIWYGDGLWHHDLYRDEEQS